MNKNRKIESFECGGDKWDFSYRRDSTFSVCVCVEVGLLRPNRKWYQFPYLYTDYAYAIGVDEIDPARLRAKAEALVNKYYNKRIANEKLDAFLAAD